MILKELFETKERLDYEVCNSLTDEIFPGINLPFKITQKGSEKFADALALEVKITDDSSSGGSRYIMVDIKDEGQIKALRIFCYARAGYVKEKDYYEWFKEDIFEISKIVIKGSSGYFCRDEGYYDKVTVTGQSIAYEYHPMVETEINPTRKWSYKTTSPIFKKLYADLAEAMPAIVKYDKAMHYLDAGWIEFILTYSDKTKFKKTFFLPGDEFKDCFQIIKRMVPETEYVPVVLLTKDDYEEK